MKPKGFSTPKGGYPLIDDAELGRLLGIMRRPGVSPEESLAARNEIVTAYLPWLRYICNRTWPGPSYSMRTHADNYSDGCLAIIECLRTFDVSRVGEFRAYVHAAIRNRTLTHANSDRSAYRLPIHAARAMGGFRKRYPWGGTREDAELYASTLHPGHSDYFMAAYDISMRPRLDLDDGDESFFVKDTRKCPQSEIDSRIDCEAVMGILDEKSAEAIREHYGLQGHEPRGLREIAADKDVTYQCIQLRIKRGIAIAKSTLGAHHDAA